MLVELLANAWNQYRQGFVYSIQHADFDSAIMYINGMLAILPEPDRPKLDPVPLPQSLQEDIMNKQKKWIWLVEANFKIEESISRWVHNNLDRINM